MAQWDNYSTKAAPADSDTMMIKDNAATGKPNKRVLFSGLWDWIVSKLANAVINSLTTNPKTVTGGMNALQTAVTTLNSNMTNQSQSMERLNSPALLTDTISPGYYYTTGATGIPTGASSNGYLRVYGRKSDLSILKVMEYRPYNSNDTYVSMRTGSESWSGWEKLPTRAEVDALNSKTELTITPSENVTLSSTSHVYVSGNFLYITVKGKATADISNAQLFSWGGGKNVIANCTCIIGIGAEWDITGAGYGFIAGNSVVSNVQNNTWFHVTLTVLVA